MSRWRIVVVGIICSYEDHVERAWLVVDALRKRVDAPRAGELRCFKRVSAESLVVDTSPQAGLLLSVTYSICASDLGIGTRLALEPLTPGMLTQPDGSTSATVSSIASSDLAPVRTMVSINSVLVLRLFCTK